ncbi:Uncharacterised protein [Mycobacteroides abscessus subsp. abscessus]|nr:Uncharacterised protein [Mycobacteroides abscessus subsp. abscessus]
MLPDRSPARLRSNAMSLVSSRSEAAMLVTNMSSPTATTGLLRRDAVWKAASSTRSEIRLPSSNCCSMSATALATSGDSSGLADRASTVMSRTPSMRRVVGWKIGWP